MVLRVYVFVIFLCVASLIPAITQAQAVVNVRNQQGSTDYSGDVHSNGGVFYGILGATNTPLEIGFRSTYDLDAAISMWAEAAQTATFQSRYRYVKDGSASSEYAVASYESVPVGEVRLNRKFEDIRPSSFLNNSSWVSLIEERSVRYDFEDLLTYHDLNGPRAIATWYW